MICRYQFRLLNSYLNYIIVCNKNIHLSHLNHVRKPSKSQKVASSSFEDIQYHSFSGVFPDLPKNEDMFKNFYGIEGDEGVINVEELPKTEKSIQGLKQTTFTPLDEYRSFNFGAVRLDSENRLNYGPRRSKKLSENNKTEQLSQENIKQSNDIESLENDKNNLSNLNVSKNVSDNFVNYDKHEPSFKNEIKQNVSPNYIRSLPKDNIYNHITNDNAQNKTDDHSLHKSSKNLIDEDYFKELHVENSHLTKDTSKHIIKESFSKTNDKKSDKEIASVSQNEDPYSSEKFFNSFVQLDEKAKIDSSSFDKNRIQKNTSNEINKPISIVEPPDNLYEGNTRFNQNKNVQDPAIRDDLTSNKRTVSTEKLEQKRGLQQKTDKTRSPAEKLEQERGLRQKTDKTRSPEKTSTHKADLTKKSYKESQAENPDKEINSTKTKDSYNKLQEKDSTVKKEIKTAYDFVKTLRKNTLLSDEVKRGISAKKEKKVDSKGFRILKHQVPSLEYFTRDEMLGLLKERVLYKDDDVVVLNKPYNLVIHESKTSQDLACLSRYLDDLAKLLNQDEKSSQLFTVHRLDKETTGTLLLARNELTATRLKSLFAQRKIVKTYWVVTVNVPDPMDGILDMPISEGKIGDRSRMVLHPNLPDDIPYKSHVKAGKQAITQYSVITVSGNAALVEVRPETGIKHQIRVHLGFGLGCPILGDHKYSYLDKLVPQKLPSDLLQRLRVRQSKVRHIPLHIHAKHVFIPQYSNGKNLVVSAPLPHHMSENLQFLKFKKN